MLQRILIKVQEGGTLETRRLAKELGAPIELVEAMLDHLQRNGLVQEFVSCTDGCGGCGLRNACVHADGSELRLWRSARDSSPRGD